MKDKNLVYGALIGIGAYIYFKKSIKNKDVISTTEEGEVKLVSNKPYSKESERIALFKRANNFYKGGAKPSEELLDRLEKERGKAMEIIKSFKLEKEFDKWRSSLSESEAYPVAKPVMVGDKPIGVGFKPEYSQPYYDPKNPPKKYSGFDGSSYLNQTGNSREEMRRLELQRQERARQRVRDKRRQAGYDSNQ